ncbi:daunorubicin resistance protein DrrA family ABC transporter ATP-binding protein [Methanosphaerula palustris]|uniref:Daunorubicin resistance ABC transporter ATPase subunit n=1 Tax=Methanosphaerula palustris (strain ATCC BAA-1556 / DSM 19958 / E1-9c) TaxID=521011 RepID=B8GE12_METPE|nr:daunorubicin resistance protein DrrA family ABC transporter ATP-binding protein [Methanosphaerula palustris]ACL17513.1 daunorubicin resistance ABC transporter ATPase subunit [Methanosphaerula palustris E1-9c]
MYAIEALSLSKRFGDLQALSAIDFTVGEGETFGFLGPNGAGKTTTIRILTGITVPTDGTARIFGSDIVQDTIAARRQMGIVHETSNIYTDLSAWQNLMFTAELYHVSRKDREKRGIDLLELFGLSGRRDDRTRGFSKGMKRRLTLAMGLINHPRLLFLDEPTSGLDVQSNLIIRDVIRELNEQGVTVFLTTHNIEEANLTCDRVAIINQGRIAAVDTPERLKKTIQSVQSIEIAFDPTSPVRSGNLEQIALVSEVRKEGDKFRLITENPPAVLDEVMEYAHEHHLRVISVNTLGPTLEDVFIRLTGLDIRTKGVKTID